MKTNFLPVLLALLISGCATTYYKPAPESYSGPLARIVDNFNFDDPKHSRFFYVEEIDGHKVENSLIATRTKNRGNGLSMKPIYFSRYIPAKKLTLKLAGKVEYAAPILAILSPESASSIEQTIELDAKADASYEVRGELSLGNSSVWLVDVATGERVGMPVTSK